MALLMFTVPVQALATSRALATSVAEQRAQAVGRVVGDAHGLVADVVERQDREHRSEDFRGRSLASLRRRRTPSAAGNSRASVPGAAAARHQARALGTTAAMYFSILARRLADDRTEHCRTE
jgi:hypothetical protein